VWHAETAKNLSDARFASREIEAIAPYSDLAARRTDAAAEAHAAIQDGALASVAAFDPTGWTFVRFRLWRDASAAIGRQAQVYSVGHLSLP
jgi:hypothetical protein